MKDKSTSRKKGDVSMIAELALGEITDLVVSVAGTVVNETNSARKWKQLFIDKDRSANREGNV